MNIAIIGAGLSGLTAAHVLKDHASIEIFEKSRGVSGRMSTRRAEPYLFDHGAQFFTAKTDQFQKFLLPAIREGVVKPWIARFVEFKKNSIIKNKQWDQCQPHYVAVPGMNALGKYLIQDVKCHLGVSVKTLLKKNGKWHVKDGEGNVLGEYDWVICALPAEQVSALLPSTISFYSDVCSVRMKACFSLMLAFQKVLPLEFDVARIHDEDIGWISVNNSKPSRGKECCLLVHSSHRWADKHIDGDQDQLAKEISAKASEIIGHSLSHAVHSALHRWRFASAEKRSGETHFIDKGQCIAVCGDWCIEGRVEAAFTSGFDLGDTLVKLINTGKII